MVPSAEQFIDLLDSQNRLFLAKLMERQTAGSGDELKIGQLLRVALKNEYEASLIAATWMADTPEVEAKLAFARQCGDEAKHYRWIEERLAALGEDLSTFDPTAPGPSPLFTYLASLKTTIERAAAGPFTREQLAVARNETFAAFCEARGDHETARLYRERIQPDEQHHQQLGRSLLLRLAVTEEAQTAARVAALGTLRIAEEVQEMAAMKAGLTRLPGC